MSGSHKPRGYTTVSPYLIVDGASRTIEFLAAAFDAVELRRFPGPDGTIMHADSTADWPPIPSYVHIYVPAVDATYRRALEAGATSVQEPIQKDDEDRRGGVRDAGGTTWWIATRVG